MAGIIFTTDGPDITDNRNRTLGSFGWDCASLHIQGRNNPCHRRYSLFLSVLAVKYVVNSSVALAPQKTEMGR